VKTLTLWLRIFKGRDGMWDFSATEERRPLNHQIICPIEIEKHPWGNPAFEVMIGPFKFMIAARQNH
jgi:hypothetical protein